MIVSKKSHQNLSDYTIFYSKKDLKLIKNRFSLEKDFYSKKKKNVGNYIYNLYPIHL